MTRSEQRITAGVIPLIAAYFFAASIATVSVPRLRAPIDELMTIAIGLLVSTSVRAKTPDRAPA